MGLFDREKNRYVVDIMGVATIVGIGCERYDDIYNKATIMYSITYHNKALEDLGDNDTISFEESAPLFFIKSRTFTLIIIS